MRSQLNPAAMAAADPANANFGRDYSVDDHAPDGTRDESDPVSATTTADEGDLEKAEKLQEQERTGEERKVHREPRSTYLVRLGRHFLGHRADR